MTGRILIVDQIATNRILLKVNLVSACYETILAPNAAASVEVARKQKPNLIVMDLDEGERRAFAAISTLRGTPETAMIPVIGTSAHPTVALRRELLRAGGEDLLAKPLNHLELMARIRGLLRAQGVHAELKLREGTSRALGFAEPSTAFAHPARIAVIGESEAASRAWKHEFSKSMQPKVVPMTVDQALSSFPGETAPDIFVLGAGLNSNGEDFSLQLMSELRSRESTRHAGIVLALDAPERQAVMALDLGASDILKPPFDNTELELRLDTQLRRKRHGDRLRRGVRDGLQLAMTDPLTGLYNRRYALSHLARLLENAKSSKQPVAVMLLDLDRFKSVNDKFGHASGDLVLQEVAQRLSSHLRSVDLIARVGGEEFLVVLPDSDNAEARGTAERLRRTIESRPIEVPGRSSQRGAKITQTASIGVAIGGQPDQLGQQASVASLLQLADEALYEAKSAGRNGIIFSHVAA